MAISLLLAHSASAFCLPGLFDGGRRLHDVLGASLFDVDTLLLQHEACHRTRDHPSEARVMMFGNSAIFGTRLEETDTVASRLNQWLDDADTPAHVYNLGFATAYQLKDAILMRASLWLEPDIIVYGVTLDDFIHLAPIPWPPDIAAMLAGNRGWIDRLADEGAEGLEPVVAIYSGLSSSGADGAGWLRRLRAFGAYLRIATRMGSRELAMNPWLGGRGEATDDLPPPLRPQRDYACGPTLTRFAEYYDDWSSWNVLAYLEVLAARSGARVLIVNWPVEYRPVNACYNSHYPTRDLSGFNTWLRREAEERGFDYVDLHDLLPLDQFADSVHPAAEGNSTISTRLQDPLSRLLPEAVDRAAARGDGDGEPVAATTP